ncbi:hypothetical protein NLI96_g8307 [Meripilus lineatus]|uniref:Uncharacterized protein n=1 Tax=Meripilus lineatus TaxID=2056292 RepID=A0AAD5UXL3_9APHY|nr:hypothetical protein NLI96_g8307 [Physisporinus lineatus]
MSSGNLDEKGIPKVTDVLTTADQNQVEVPQPSTVSPSSNDTASFWLRSGIAQPLAIVDNINPIAWGKVSTWYFHPGRHAKNTTPAWSIIVRIMFLILNFFTVFLSYLGILLTPLNSPTLSSSLTPLLPKDPYIRDLLFFVEGLKYSGFTNHILQTLLYRPSTEFGKHLMNSSRHYMDELQATAYYILKRVRVDNHPRTLIGKFANDVQATTYPVDTKTGEIGSTTSTYGFAFRSKTSQTIVFYGLFFTTNAILQAILYNPFFSRLVEGLSMLHYP